MTKIIKAEIFNKILNKWSENTGVDIENQIKKWNAKDENKKDNEVTPYKFKEEN